MRRLRLQTRVLITAMALVTLAVMLTGGLSLSMLRNALIAGIGEDALDVARTVARTPTVAEALKNGDPSGDIQKLAQQIRIATGADFVVVGDKSGRRYSHPNPERIGETMVGGDNAGALTEGREYVSVATGTLGPSMRGKVPILDENGAVIGVVSVGFLLREVDRTVGAYVLKLGLALLLGLAIAVPGAWALARSIKCAIHGLEPEEIAALSVQQRAILGAIREGIIAIDRSERVIVANDSARTLLPGLETGVHVREVLPNSKLPEVLASGEPELDQPMLLGDIPVVTNRVPVRLEGQVVGVVASFRDRSELEELTRQLTDTRRYTEELRAQAHEFANTLQVVSGMIQLNRGDEAVEFIRTVIQENRQVSEAVPRAIADPAVVALILGKRARAEEVRCQFVLDPASRIERPVARPMLLVRIIGNLVDNAFDAVAGGQGEKRVRLRLDDRNGQILIEVADSGPGIDPAHAQLIFTEGFSTKGSGRGVGLALVKRLVTGAGGEITVGTAPEGGALFRVILPHLLPDAAATA